MLRNISLHLLAEAMRKVFIKTLQEVVLVLEIKMWFDYTATDLIFTQIFQLIYRNKIFVD